LKKNQNFAKVPEIENMGSQRAFSEQIIEKYFLEKKLHQFTLCCFIFDFWRKSLKKMYFLVILKMTAVIYKVDHDQRLSLNIFLLITDYLNLSAYLEFHTQLLLGKSHWKINWHWTKYVLIICIYRVL